MTPDLSFEQAYSGIVCGVDEVGRGPWAGPLVVAAIILDRTAIPDGIRDSKMLTAKRRAAIAALLHETATCGIGSVEAPELDRIGLTAANDLAMARAISALPVLPDFALIDGKRAPKGMPCPARPIIKGDGKSLSIAAASIIAKAHRDALMATLAIRHPGYAWETNMGYGTRAHAEGLKKLGVTCEHRRCFRPVREFISEENAIHI